jgi:hypothetical protein
MKAALRRLRRPPWPREELPKLVLSLHAIDRFSTRGSDLFPDLCSPEDGIIGVMMRLALPMIGEVGRGRKTSIERHGLRWVFRRIPGNRILLVTVILDSAPLNNRQLAQELRRTGWAEPAGRDRAREEKSHV